MFRIGISLYGYYPSEEVRKDIVSLTPALTLKSEIAYIKTVPAGTAIEVYATTLHYAPCHVNESGFQCVVVLPKGTNTELTFEKAAEGEDKLLTAKNKWLIGHEEAAIEGAFNGLKGENVGID